MEFHDENGVSKVWPNNLNHNIAHVYFTDNQAHSLRCVVFAMGLLPDT